MAKAEMGFKGLATVALRRYGLFACAIMPGESPCAKHCAWMKSATAA